MILHVNSCDHMVLIERKMCVRMCVCVNGGICFHSSTKIEKEKREHAKQHGMIRTEITGAEIAEEMEKERRLFQLQMCEVRRDFSPSPRVSLAGPSCGQQPPA